MPLCTLPALVHLDISLTFPTFSEINGKPDAAASNITKGEHSIRDVKIKMSELA